MSHCIYKTVKQLEDGSFQANSAESNVRTSSGGLSFGTYIITYYNKTFPALTDLQKKHLFVIDTLYSGDKFYQANWKDLQKKAADFLSSSYFNQVERHALREDICQLKIMLNDFADYLRALPKESIRKYIVRVGGYGSGQDYITRIKKKRMFLGSKDDAKVFTSKLSVVQNRLIGYSKYGLVYEQVN